MPFPWIDLDTKRHSKLEQLYCWKKISIQKKECGTLWLPSFYVIFSWFIWSFTMVYHQLVYQTINHQPNINHDLLVNHGKPLFLLFFITFWHVFAMLVSSIFNWPTCCHSQCSQLWRNHRRCRLRAQTWMSTSEKSTSTVEHAGNEGPTNKNPMGI